MANEYNNLQNAKRSSIGNKFFVFVLIFLGFISGVVVGFIVNGSLKSDVDSSLLLREKGYEFISPLIDVEPREMSTLKKINDLEVKLNVLVTNLTTDTETYKAKSISVYYKELSSGAWIGINEKEQFAPASLLKVPLMIAYYKLAESNPSILNKKIKYKQIDNDFTQNVQPSLTLKNNMDYTLDEVINSMIIESDNQAMFSLVNSIKEQDLQKVYEDLGIASPPILDANASDFISVKEYAAFFRILYNSSYLDKEMSTKALKLLTQVKFTNGLLSGIPKGVIVAHKFGERGFDDSTVKQLHDCGIVYVPKNPYIVCVMTRGESLPNLEKIIQKISNLIYKSVAF